MGNSGVRLLPLFFFPRVGNNSFGKSFFSHNHEPFFPLGFFQVKKVLSKVVAISSQDIFIDPNHTFRASKYQKTVGNVIDVF